MAYTGLIPVTIVQEAQDAKGLKLKDDSTWGAGDQAATTKCDVYVQWYDDNDVLQQCDVYPLIVGAVTTKFDEYIGVNGHNIDIADLTINGVSIGETFVEGYFIIKTVYSDGSYAVGSEPFYENHEAFLAENWCMARKLPAKLEWPLTEAEYLKNRDISLQRMYLEATEDAVDLGKYTEFKRLMTLIRNIFNNYEISSCF
jgi:hypothetical protein